MKFNLSNQETINNAIATFVLTLPSDLSAYASVTPDTNAIFPYAIIYNQKVIPISYNATTNTITLAS